MGITQSFASFGHAFGPIIGGSLAAVFGIRISFVITSILLIATSRIAKKFIKRPISSEPLLESE